MSQDDAAALLLQDCQRSANSEALLPYNETCVSRTIAQIQALDQKVRQLLRAGANPVALGAVLVFHATLLRKKRILLTYWMQRMRVIENSRFKHGSVCPESMTRHMSESEQSYFKAYDKLVSKYMGDTDTDLTLDLAGPPKELFIEVRVLKDLGEIVLGNGSTIRLDRGTTHFLRRTDVDPLIRQNYVKRSSSGV